MAAAEACENLLARAIDALLSSPQITTSLSDELRPEELVELTKVLELVLSSGYTASEISTALKTREMSRARMQAYKATHLEEYHIKQAAYAREVRKKRKLAKAQNGVS